MPELDLIPKDSNLEDAIEVLNKNALNLGRFFGKSGVNLLAEKVTGTAQSVTSATYVKVSELQNGFESSGGLIVVLAVMSVAVPSAQTGTFQLKIDDNEKDVCQSSSAAGVLSERVTLLWVGGDLPAGKHSVKVFTKVDGGTLTVTTAGNKSCLYILEFLRG